MRGRPLTDTSRRGSLYPMGLQHFAAALGRHALAAARVRSSFLAVLAMVGAVAFPAFAACAQERSQETPAPAPQFVNGPGPSQPTASSGIGPLFQAPFGRDHLLGDWGGLRTSLLSYGVNVEFDYLTESAGNPLGGRRQGIESAGQIGLEIDLDFAKITGWQGFANHMMIVQRNGRNLSADDIGDNIATAQEIFGGGGNVLAHLVYAYGEQELADGRIDIAAGRLPILTYFAASPLNCYFMNVIACGNAQPLAEYPGITEWPAANWGGQIRALPTLSTYVMAGLFEVNPNNGGISGWSWGEPGATGVSVPIEVGWEPRFSDDNLVGHYKIGFDEDTSPYPNLLNDAAGHPALISGNAAAQASGRRQYYVLLDQMLARTGPSDTDGLILLGGYIHADSATSALSDHAYLGLLTSAGLLGRPEDSFGIKFDYLKMSAALTQAQELEQELGLPLSNGGLGPAFGIQTHEEVLEAAYTARVYPGVTIMPDIQYIMQPGATTTFRNALVLGIRTNVRF
ncbi:MAG: carbohydrate porin [Methylocella sp.]